MTQSVVCGARKRATSQELSDELHNAHFRRQTSIVLSMSMKGKKILS